MSRVARSIFVFGLYIAVLGLLLSTVPGLVVKPFGFPQPEEPWIRCLILVGFTLLAAAGRVVPARIIFGVIDAAGAARTALEMRTSHRTGA